MKSVTGRPGRPLKCRVVAGIDKLRAPKGTRDILAPDSARQRHLVDRFAAIVESAGYGQVISPMFEDVAVFSRVGESTDIVTKEMFAFTDRDDPPQHLALRPELTASIARAFVQHRPTAPWAVWYEGPQFRYERPQAGRYRQFMQVGVEVLGSADPLADVDTIVLAQEFFDDIGLTDTSLMVNSMGDEQCRPAYLDAVRGHFTEHAAALSEQSRETLAKNPLRVFDSKRPPDQPIIDTAPSLVDHLCADCLAHFDDVRSALDRLEVDYVLSPRLVRGLDYYRRTTFEFIAPGLDTAQNAIGGGGRYDGLVEQFGGPPTPGVGFALGVDRILLACDAADVFAAPDDSADVFIVDVVGGVEASVLSQQLRRAGLVVTRGFDQRSMKAQMKLADRSGARVAIIIGEQELSDGAVTVRHLRADSDQHAVPYPDIVSHLQELFR